MVGILRVNKRNRSDAYISTEVLDADIYICGSKDRNRALEGDIVAVELLDVDDVWGTKKEKEEKKRKKEENAAYDTRAVANRKNDKKKDDVEVEGQGLMLFEDEECVMTVICFFPGTNDLVTGSLTTSSLSSLVTSLLWWSECQANSSLAHLDFSAHLLRLRRRSRKLNVVNVRVIAARMTNRSRQRGPRSFGSSLLTSAFLLLRSPLSKRHLTSFRIPRRMLTDSLLRALSVMYEFVSSHHVQGH